MELQCPQNESPQQTVAVIILSALIIIITNAATRWKRPKTQPEIQGAAPDPQPTPSSNLVLNQCLKKKKQPKEVLLKALVLKVHFKWVEAKVQQREGHSGLKLGQRRKKW